MIALPVPIAELINVLDFAPEVFAGVSHLVRRPAATAMRANVTIYSGADAVGQARADWIALERTGARPTVFQSLAVAEVAAEAHLLKGETPIVVVVTRANARTKRPVLLIAGVLFSKVGARGFRLLGDPLIQYGDILAAADATQEEFDEAWRAICDPARAQFVHLRKIRANGALARFLDFGANIVSTTAAPFADLGVASLPRPTREQRRMQKKLAAMGDLTMRLVDGEGLTPMLRLALAHKRRWLATRGLPSAVIGDEIWENALLHLSARRGIGMQMTGAQFEVGGKPVAFEVALTDGSVWSAYLGAYDDDYSAFGAGNMLTAELLRADRDHGFRCYDFMAPADPYKTARATGAIDVHDYAIATDIAGRPYVSALRAAPALKKYLIRLSPAQRRAIATAIRRAGFTS